MSNENRWLFFVILWSGLVLCFNFLLVYDYRLDVITHSVYVKIIWKEFIELLKILIHYKVTLLYSWFVILEVNAE